MSAKNKFEHILYEVEMFLFSYCHLESPDTRMHNMAADAFAIHLRNLAFFFRAEKSAGKGGDYWHISDVVASTQHLRLFDDDALFGDVNKYASRATGHLLDDRCEEPFKSNTDLCYRKAIPLVVNAITDFLDQAPAIVKPDLKAFWEEDYIQENVLRIRFLMQSMDQGLKR